VSKSKGWEYFRKIFISLTRMGEYQSLCLRNSYNMPTGIFSLHLDMVYLGVVYTLWSLTFLYKCLDKRRYLCSYQGPGVTLVVMRCFHILPFRLDVSFVFLEMAFECSCHQSPPTCISVPVWRFATAPSVPLDRSCTLPPASSPVLLHQELDTWTYIYIQRK
jgi:hypothetical protein